MVLGTAGILGNLLLDVSIELVEKGPQFGGVALSCELHVLLLIFF